MRLIGKHNSPEVAKAYDWSRFPVIADIGGGIGGLLLDILDAYPSCRGILFDESKVVQQAISHDRLEAIGGDFFRACLPGPMPISCGGSFTIGLRRTPWLSSTKYERP
jgi:hypothetical protein